MLGMQDMIQFFKQISKFGSNIYAGIQDPTNKQQLSFFRQLQKETMGNSSLYIPLKNLKTVIFDLETTGFYPEKGDFILSIGAVKMTGEKIEDGSFYSLVKSELPLSNEITLLTNIRDTDLKNAPDTKEVYLQFLKYVSARILVAHHSGHERSFMHKMSWNTLHARFPHRIIDTSFLTSLSSPAMVAMSLDEVCEHCGVEIKNRHNALGDAKMTAIIWGHYLNKAQAMGFENLHDIYEFLAKLK